MFKLILYLDKEKGTKTHPFTLSALVPGQAMLRKPDFQFAKLHRGACKENFCQFDNWLDRMGKQKNNQNKQTTTRLK